MFVFFKQKTAYEMLISDWSSDVCSSDLERREMRERRNEVVMNEHPVEERQHGGRIGRALQRLPVSAQFFHHHVIAAERQRDEYRECRPAGPEDRKSVV